MLLLIDLPKDIFSVIQMYLAHKDYRNILNSCKITTFQELKKESCCFYLSPTSTEKYLINPIFRQQILSLMTNPENQLGLYVNQRYCVPDWSKVNKSKSVSLFNSSSEASNSLPNPLPLPSVQKLTIHGHKHFTCCNGLFSLVELKLGILSAISDLTPLCDSRIQKLELWHCPLVVFVSRLPFLEKLYVIHCKSFTHYSDLPNLKKLVMRLSPNSKINYSDTPKILELFTEDFISTKIFTFSYLHSLKVCCYNRGFNINILAQLPHLKALDLVSPGEFNVHRFQQLVYLSVTNAELFIGIIKPMPNLRTLNIVSCDRFYTLSGLENNRRMRLRIEEDCELEFKLDLMFFKFLLESVSIFIYESAGKSKLSKTAMNQFIGIRQIRDKSLQFARPPPFTGSLLSTLFLNTRMLVIGEFKIYQDLSKYVEFGIHKIPVLCLSYATNVRSLYPPEIVPEHNWVILRHCEKLEDVSCLRSVSRVTIIRCDKLMDIRPLTSCERIEFLRGFYTRSDPLGYDELKDRIEKPLDSPEEIEELRKYFPIEKLEPN